MNPFRIGPSLRSVTRARPLEAPACTIGNYRWHEAAESFTAFWGPTHATRPHPGGVWTWAWRGGKI
jgi:hypothetical protein